MEQFSELIHDKNFDLGDYQKPTLKALKELEKNTGFKWHLNKKKEMTQYYNLLVGLISNNSTNTGGLIFKDSDNLEGVVRV